MIEVKQIVELLAIMVGIKLILEKWEPPIRVSLQALIMLAIGGTGGWFMNPSREGLITGLLGGTIAFWGRGIFAEIKEIQDVSEDLKK